MILNTSNSHLAVQRFHPAQSGDTPLAIDACSPPPITSINHVYVGQGESPPVTIWHQQLDGLATEQVIQARADVTFVLAAGGPNCNDACVKQCVPLVDAGFYLSRFTNPTAQQLSSDPYTREMSQSTVDPNLTWSAPVNTISLSGSLRVDDSMLGSGTPMYVILVTHNGAGPGSFTCPRSAIIEESSSNASVIRYRPANTGELGWSVRAASSSTVLSSSVPPGSGNWGPERFIYSVPVSVLAGDVIDATASAEFAWNGSTSPLMMNGLKFNGVSFNYPGFKSLDPRMERADFSHSGQYVVPDNVGPGYHVGWVTYSVEAFQAAGAAARDVLVDSPAGGLSVVVYHNLSPPPNARPSLADLNGDGKADAVAYAPDTGSWYAALSNGGSFNPGALWIAGHGIGSNNQFLADVNGDGKTDAIVYFGNTGTWYAALSNGGGFNNYSLWIAGHGIGSNNQFLADVNGDGKADAIVYFGNTGTWYAALSNGGGFNNYSQWIAGHGIGSANQLLGDANGDGKADATVYFGPSALTGNWYVALSNGGGFNDYSQWNNGYF